MGLLSTIVAETRLALAKYFAAELGPVPRDVAKRVVTPNPWTDRDAAVIGSSLTPQRLTQLLRERNAGYLQGWVDLADEAREKSPHLHTQLAIREQSVVETEFEVVPGSGSNQRAAERAASAARLLMERWSAREEEGLETWLAEFVEASYYGRGAHEVMWERSPEGLVVPAALSKIDPRRLGYACDSADPDPWGLRLWDDGAAMTPYSDTYGVPLSSFHPDKILVNQPRVRGSQRSREGLFAVVVWYWLFSVWSWRDVMALAEMIGRPPVIGYYAAGGAKDAGALQKFDGARTASPQDVAAAKRAVNAMTSALRAVLPDTTRLEPLKFDTPPGKALQLQIDEAANAHISKAINGSTGVSDIVAGARASHQVAYAQSFTFWRADCRRAARLLTTLLQRMVRANPDYFGANCPLPIVKAKTETLDAVAALAIIEKAQKVGMRVSRKYAHAQTGVIEPERPRGEKAPEGDDLLVPAKTSVPSNEPAPPEGAKPNEPSDPAAEGDAQ